MLRQEAEELRRQIALSKRAEKNKQSKEKEELERKAREAQEQKEQEEAALARWEAKQKGELDGDSKTTQPLVDDLETFSADFASYKAKSKKAIKVRSYKIIVCPQFIESESFCQIQVLLVEYMRFRILF